MKSAPRIEKLRAKMEAEAQVIQVSNNVSYLTAFDGIADEENPHILLITVDEVVLFTDTRYVEVATKQAERERIVKVVCTGKWVEEELKSYLKAKTLKSLALEDQISHAQFTKLSNMITELGIEVQASSGLVEALRIVKDDEEIERIARAQEITDLAFEKLLSEIKVGMTEAELSAKLTYLLLSSGATGLAFPNIVASGPNGSLPHANPGERKLEAGDFITLDFGAEYKGYKSDMTRTVALSPISEGQREVYETVLAAQEASLEKLQAGITGIEADEPARSLIAERGYAEYFGHGLGHGVGLDIHETPNASPRSEAVLPLNATLTVEPGIYLPNKYGVRIEDLVVLGEKGIRNLTKSPKQLIEI